MKLLTVRYDNDVSALARVHVGLRYHARARCAPLEEWIVSVSVCRSVSGRDPIYV